MKIVNNVYMEMTDAEVAQGNADAEAADLDMNMVRSQRNGMLSAADWTQIGDASLGDHTAEEWRTYRTALKAIPQTYSRVSEVVWPEDPPTAKITRKVTAGEAARQSSIDGGDTAEEAQTAYDTAYAATD
jgi:hypothetical protein